MRGNLQVSTQVSVTMNGVPVSLARDFNYSPAVEELVNSLVELATGVTPLAIAPLTAGQLGFVLVANLDPANVLTVSTNADGSAPFATIAAQRHLVLPATPGQNYYFAVSNGPIEALVLALSD